MSVRRWMKRSIPFAAAMLVGAAPAVFAQGQEIFEWTGRVDREVQVSPGARPAAVEGATGRARTRVMSNVPLRDGQVTVRVLDGRGNVDVMQQPSSQNGYTTVVRIQDRSGGADNYHIAAYWQGAANGEYIGRDRNRGSTGFPVERGVNGGGVAQAQSMLHWSGNVDGELEIRIQNGRVNYRTISGAQPTSMRADRGAMSSPRANGTVYISQSQGRGSVNVIQQPSSNNGYTTVLRVRDSQGGYGFYNFDVMWQ